MASPSPLSRKLQVKGGNRVLVLGPAPASFVGGLLPLPEDASTSDDPEVAADVVVVFARNGAALSELAPAALSALKDGGVLWGAYPKGSSKVETDLSRDRGWDAFYDAGLQVVAAISVDDTWSGLRFRPRTG
jgi:hypothetical protein